MSADDKRNDGRRRLAKTFRDAVGRLLARNELAFRVARRIVDMHEGNNDCDMRTNGELQFARGVLPLCRVVFDVGANVGDWTKGALAINERAQYHCFEPSLETFAALAARQFPASVRLNNFGLGSAIEQRPLFVFGAGGEANSLYNRPSTSSVQQPRELVTLRTLDDYCAEYGLDEIDFVKIDVEGHEVAALRGASRMLSTGRIGIVQLEYGGTYIDSRTLLKDIWNLMSDCDSGYRLFKLFPDGPRRFAEYSQSFETFQYSNWVSARPDWAERFEARARAK
jgi:FkbM family methyltransferase